MPQRKRRCPGRRGSSVGRKRAGNPLPVARSQGRAGLLEKQAQQQQQQERPDDTFLGRAASRFVPLTGGVCLSGRSCCVLSTQKQKLGRSCWHAAEEAGHFPGPKRPLIRCSSGCATPPKDARRLPHHRFHTTPDSGGTRQSARRATRDVTCSRRLLTARWVHGRNTLRPPFTHCSRRKRGVTKKWSFFGNCSCRERGLVKQCV